MVRPGWLFSSRVRLHQRFAAGSLPLALMPGWPMPDGKPGTAFMNLGANLLRQTRDSYNLACGLGGAMDGSGGAGIVCGPIGDRSIASARERTEPHLGVPIMRRKGITVVVVTGCTYGRDEALLLVGNLLLT